MFKKPTYEALEQRIRQLEKDASERERYAHQQAEKALQESENRYRDLFDNTENLIQCVRTDGSFVYVNPAWRKALGYGEDEIDKLSMFDVIHPDHQDECLQQFQRIIAGENLGSIETAFVSKAGETVMVEGSSSCLIQDGKPVATRGIFQNITDRKQSEEKAKRFKRVIEDSLNEIYIFDADTLRFIEVNRGARKNLGYSAEELRGLTPLDLKPEFTPESFNQLIEPLRTGGEEILHFNTSHRRKDGTHYPVEAYLQLMQGSPPLFVAIILDITVRKRAEEERKKMESQLSNAMEMANLGYWEYDVTADRFTFSDQFYNIFQTTAKAVGGYQMSSSEYSDRFVHPQDRNMIREEVRKAIQTTDPDFRRQLEHRIIYPDGKIGHITVRFFIIKDANGKTVKTYGVNQNITDRKQIEQALENRMISLTRPLDDPGQITFQDLFDLDDIQRLQNLFAQATGVASIITDTEGVPITQPSNFCRLCKDIIRTTEDGRFNCHQSDALLGRRNLARPIIQPCLIGGLWDAGAAISVGGKHIANWLIGQVRDETQTDEKIRAYAKKIGADEHAAMEAFDDVPSMSREQFEIVSQTLFTLANQLSTAAYQNIQQARFINQIKQAEKELRLSQERMQAILEASPDPVVVYDNLGHPTFLNPAFSRLFGWTHEELLDRRIPFVPESEKEATQATIKKLFQKGGTISFETKRLTKDERQLDVLVSAAIISDEQGQANGMVVNLTDLSHLKKMERQLHQAQKMESVGRLAGGVAHDFNNILSVIIGYTELALDQVEPTQSLYSALQEIHKASQRSANITQQLLAFARKQTIAPKIIDINKIVRNMLSMLHRLIGEDIDLIWSPGREIWPIKVDPSQIDQILANLCINARDAIAGVGKITLETIRTTLDEDFCANHPGCLPGDYVMLAVTDDGTGMDPNTVKNCFEPFFTTKNMDKGTGLGLATVYGIIKQNDGYIDVASKPNAGTTFKLYLPRHKTQAEPLLENRTQQPVVGGNETILLVEDELSILKMAKKMLERMGYNVLVAPTPEESLTWVQQHDGPIHLLITDVIMPGMNGRELADKLKSIYPNIKYIFMSGYTANVIADQGVLDVGVNFIQKPFSAKGLSNKVREVLDEIQE